MFLMIVTGIFVGITSVPMYEFDLVFDRPYFFAIHDNRTGAILFMGTVAEPEGGTLPKRKE